MAPVKLGDRPPTVQRYRQRWWPFARTTGPRLGTSVAKPIPSPVRKGPRSAVPVTSPPSLPKPAAGKAAKSTTSSGWLFREAVALVGITGAALTVLAHLAWHIRLSMPFMDVLGWWMTVNSDFWLSYYDQLGFYPPSHLQAAIAFALFLALIGFGARVSATLAGTPRDRQWSVFQGITWPSLTIMGVLGILFLIGHDFDPASGDDSGPSGIGSIKYLFAIILAAGYGAGDYFGQRGFHTRLYWLAILLVLLLALNHWLLISR